MKWLLSIGLALLTLNLFFVFEYSVVKLFEFIDNNENIGCVILIGILVILTIVIHRFI